MFDFPNSPTVGQIAQNATSGSSWQWNGVKWGPVHRQTSEGNYV